MTRSADLRRRSEKTVLVKREGSFLSEDEERNYSEVVQMEDIIEVYRDTYAQDLQKRLNLNDDKLPRALSISTLLNPIFGLKPRVVGCGMMTDRQYDRARKDLVQSMQDILDAASPIIVTAMDDSDIDMDSDDDALPQTENINYNLADKELSVFESFKRSKYRPTFDRQNGHVLTGKYEGSVKECFVGPATKRGKDLPSGKNLIDYINKQGRISLLHFFGDHKDRFPTMWILVQREASRRVVEVGCERFFGLSGYISSPRRTRLGVRNYERLAMLSSILRVMYINPEWVSKEYLTRCKSGTWKQTNDNESLKCWNLERILESEQFGEMKTKDLTMDDLIGELEEDNEGTRKEY
jgi:hypothetical protein